MRSLAFEGSTWEAYEKMLEKDKKLHKALYKLLKEILRSDDPSTGIRVTRLFSYSQACTHEAAAPLA